MQYIAKCTEPDCDHYLQAPHERDVERSARKHTEETDHIVRLTGVYDSPTNGGLWKSGYPMPLNPLERDEIEQDLRARYQKSQ